MAGLTRPTHADPWSNDPLAVVGRGLRAGVAAGALLGGLVGIVFGLFFGVVIGALYGGVIGVLLGLWCGVLLAALRGLLTTRPRAALAAAVFAGVSSAPLTDTLLPRAGWGGFLAAAVLCAVVGAIVGPGTVHGRRNVRVPQ